MNNKLILSFMLCMMLISLASAAQDNQGTSKINEQINIFQTCEGCTSVTISAITYPNSTVFISGVSMSTTDNFFYNYTVNSSLVTEVGTYTINGFDNTGSVFSFDKEVTNTGTILSDSQSWLYVVGILSLFIISALLIWGAFELDKLPQSVRLFLLGLAVVIIVVAIGLTLGILNNFGDNSTGVNGAFGKVYIALVVLLIGGGMGLMLWLLVQGVMFLWRRKGFID